MLDWRTGLGCRRSASLSFLLFRHLSFPSPSPYLHVLGQSGRSLPFAVYYRMTLNTSQTCNSSHAIAMVSFLVGLLQSPFSLHVRFGHSGLTPSSYK